MMNTEVTPALLTPVTRYTIEARDSHGNWDARHAGESVAFDSREAAEAEIPRLAEIQESPESDYRVVEVASAEEAAEVAS